MKKFFLLLVLISYHNCYSQKVWDKLKIDSASFALMYGTEQQYEYQNSIGNKSSHKELRLFSGAQFNYLYEFSYYLGLRNYNVTYSPDDGITTITATPKIYNTPKPPKVKVVAKQNKYAQITSITITGPANDLIDIFVDYWELSKLSLNEIKTKKQVVKDFVSDKIAIKWINNRLLILVTKNPNAPVDLFPFKK